MAKAGVLHLLNIHCEFCVFDTIDHFQIVLDLLFTIWRVFYLFFVDYHYEYVTDKPGKYRYHATDRKPW